MLRLTEHIPENCSTLFWFRLVQSKIPMCRHWKLKPHAHHKRASVQRVTVQASPALFFRDWNHLERSTHSIDSVFHFHGPLSHEYLAFSHNFSNTSVWYFFLQSLATKTVVYNSWLCLLRQSLYGKCLSTDIASTKGHCSLENSMPNGSGLPGIRKRLSGSAELCTQYLVYFVSFWLVQMVQIFAELH